MMFHRSAQEIKMAAKSWRREALAARSVKPLEARVRELELRVEELYIYTGQQERLKDLKAFEKYKEYKKRRDISTGYETYDAENPCASI